MFVELKLVLTLVLTLVLIRQSFAIIVNRTYGIPSFPVDTGRFRTGVDISQYPCFNDQSEGALYVQHLKELMYTLLKGRIIDRYNLSSCFFRMVESQSRIHNIRTFFPEQDLNPYVWDICNVSSHCMYYRRRITPEILTAPENVKVMAQIVHQDAACYVKQYSCNLYPEFLPLIKRASTSFDYTLSKFIRLALPCLILCMFNV